MSENMEEQEPSAQSPASEAQETETTPLAGPVPLRASR